MKLPHGPAAIVEIAKLRDYSLNPAHKEGKHKARVFAAALGIGPPEAAWLREKLLAAAVARRVRPDAPPNLASATSSTSPWRARVIRPPFAASGTSVLMNMCLALSPATC
jgi:hypothetical protein